MSPLVEEPDIDAVSAQLRSMWIGRGERVAELERKMAAWVGAKHAVCLGSGTAALVVALRHIPCSRVAYPRICAALDIAVKLAGKERGEGAVITVYPVLHGFEDDIVDFARCLPAKGEVELKARFGVFSFGALKDVSGGLGGCVVSHDPMDAEEWKKVSPLSDINAAMILAQLARYQGKSPKRLVADGRTWSLE